MADIVIVAYQSGIWTAPAGLTSIDRLLTTGPGGNNGGAGGDSGFSNNVAVTPGSTYTITINTTLSGFSGGAEVYAATFEGHAGANGPSGAGSLTALSLDDNDAGGSGSATAGGGAAGMDSGGLDASGSTPGIGGNVTDGDHMWLDLLATGGNGGTSGHAGHRPGGGGGLGASGALGMVWIRYTSAVLPVAPFYLIKNVGSVLVYGFGYAADMSPPHSWSTAEKRHAEMMWNQ